MAAESKPQTIGAVERAADVLNAFTELDGATAGVTELSERLGLSKAVVHRILASLRDRASLLWMKRPGGIRSGRHHLRSD